MKKDELVVLDNGISVEEMASMPACCSGSQAPVR